MQIVLYYYGKVRDRHAQAICDEYVKRCQRYARFELRELKPKQESWNHPEATKILLSPDGEEMTTPDFAAMVESARSAARDLHMVIGPTDGHPDQWKRQADRLLCLSKMTFPHELARAMLCEQVYRALTLLAGHPYSR